MTTLRAGVCADKNHFNRSAGNYIPAALRPNGVCNLYHTMLVLLLCPRFAFCRWERDEKMSGYAYRKGKCNVTDRTLICVLRGSKTHAFFMYSEQ